MSAYRDQMSIQLNFIIMVYKMSLLALVISKWGWIEKILRWKEKIQSKPYTQNILGERLALWKGTLLDILFNVP